MTQDSIILANKTHTLRVRATRAKHDECLLLFKTDFAKYNQRAFGMLLLKEQGLRTKDHAGRYRVSDYEDPKGKKTNN